MPSPYPKAAPPGHELDCLRCQPRTSALAIAKALTLREVFRLGLAPDLAIPDHSTLSRRAETLSIPEPKAGETPMHLLVDSTGLRLCGPGEWLVEKPGSKRRRAWRKLHIGVDADTGQIVAATLTPPDLDDASQVGPPLDQVASPITSFTGDGAYDRDDVYAAFRKRHPDAAVIVPPRLNAVPSVAADTNPPQRDRHLQQIAAHGRLGWHRSAGYNYRALVEADIGRFKRAIGDVLRSRTDGRRATEVDMAVPVLHCMLELGQPEYIRLV